LSLVCVVHSRIEGGDAIGWLLVTRPFPPSSLWPRALLNLLGIKSQGDDPGVRRAEIEDEDASDEREEGLTEECSGWGGTVKPSRSVVAAEGVRGPARS
jgi:hypothetical protein